MEIIVPINSTIITFNNILKGVTGDKYKEVISLSEFSFSFSSDINFCIWSFLINLIFVSKMDIIIKIILNEIAIDNRISVVKLIIIFSYHC